MFKSLEAITDWVDACFLPIHCFFFLPFLDNPLLFWFSRHISLWGSISFNLAVFINLAVALFYPFGDDGDEGKWNLVLFFLLILDAFHSKVARSCKTASSGVLVSAEAM